MQGCQEVSGQHLALENINLLDQSAKTCTFYTFPPEFIPYPLRPLIRHGHGVDLQVW